MNKLNYLLLLVVSVITLPGCEAIGSIFKAGVWVGVIVVVVLLVIIGLIVRMFKG